jgi:alcohol dehydrogenase (cytochrome c)
MRPTYARFARLAVLVPLVAGVTLTAQQPAPPGPVTNQELIDGLKTDGSAWLTFGGNYSNHRFSPLTQITPENVSKLQPAWTFQTNTLGNFETTTLLRDNVLYVTGPQNVAWAVDARSGRQIWRYRRELPENLTACCGLVNRGFAALGDRLFMTTLDAHLLALDMKTGAIVWDATLEDYKVGYASTLAPIVVKDKVIVGVAGGEYGIRGFIDAYDAQSGKRAWRFFTIPGPGEAGNNSWSGESWKIGGSGVWVTGAYDPEQNAIFFGTGNPGPDYHSGSREGDNLYSCSLLVLDADTGKLKWHYQFTPHDLHDYDSTEVPVLADLTINGQPRKTVMFANRNGFYYTLDRITGKVIVAKPFVQTTWAKSVDVQGRPMLEPGHTPDEKGERTCPDLTGGTNFWPPSYDPRSHLFYVNAREACATFYGYKPDYVAGQRYTGGAQQLINNRDEKPFGALRAIDPVTGDRKWEFVMPTPSRAGILTTASNLLMSGDGDGNLIVLDSRTGKLLWRYQMGATLHGTSPITYMLDGRQHVLVPAGTSLTDWTLPEAPAATR